MLFINSEKYIRDVGISTLEFKFQICNIKWPCYDQYEPSVL